jgi:hypothetical protein
MQENENSTFVSLLIASKFSLLVEKCYPVTNFVQLFVVFRDRRLDRIRKTATTTTFNVMECCDCLV